MISFYDLEKEVEEKDIWLLKIDMEVSLCFIYSAFVACITNTNFAGPTEFERGDVLSKSYGRRNYARDFQTQ